MIIWDIEADGLLDTLTKVHILSWFDTRTKAKGRCIGHDQIWDFISKRFMYSDGMTCKHGGHNVIGYDIPALQKIFPEFRPVMDIVTDTLVLSRLIHTDLFETDCDEELIPKKLYGSHSLEAWGNRLGDYKGDYTGPWDVPSKEMFDYCDQDVVVTAKLWEKFNALCYSESAIKLEHDVQWIIQRQIRNGVQFDTEKASLLYAVLLDERTRVAKELRDVFPGIYVSDGETTPKRSMNRLGVSYTEGVPYTKVSIQEFNPGSRQQIAQRFIRKYGWEPTAFSEKGQVKIDEDVLKKLNFPEASVLLRYLLIDKRLGQLSDGQNGWLKLVTRAGRIHGNVNSNGAVTGRMTHSTPNLAQVPAEGAPYGKECRELFMPRKGWVQIGCDASGLELRMLAHYMGRYDGGKYAKTVVDGKKEDGTDIHTVNQKAAGLPTRDDAKTFIYALLYGAGDGKIGSIIKKGREAGKRIKAKFFATLPALEKLVNAVQDALKEKGHLLGLDGRKLNIRSDHSALNTLLQGAGALVMKKALVILDKDLQKNGLVPGIDYEFMLNIHDEFQIECRAELSTNVSWLARDSIKKAGEFFNLRCPLDGEAKVGNNWAETH